MSEPNHPQNDAPATTPDGQAAEHPTAPASRSPASGNGERSTIDHTAQRRSTKARRPGAPDGNGNAMKHGLHSRRLFGVAELPAEFRYASVRAREALESLEAAAIGRYGSIALPLASKIASVAETVRDYHVCARLFADTEADATMPAAERRSALERLSGRMARARADAVKAIDALRLETSTLDDAWQAYDAHLARQRALAVSSDSSAGPAANHASNAAVGDSGQRIADNLMPLLPPGF